MTVKYINSRNMEIDLLSFPTRVKDVNFHQYTWGYDGSDQQYGANITKFTKDPIQYEATVIFRGTVDRRKEKLNNFTETTEVDIINRTPGKLICGDYYIQAYAISSSTAPYDGADWTQKDVTFLCPYPFWIREEKRSFTPLKITGDTDDNFLDYEYDYLYDYTAPTAGNAIWMVDHYAPCEFLMTIFGEASEPRIFVNGHPYQIYTTLMPNEYLQIDSRKNTVMKFMANGTRQDLYDMRAKLQTVFEPITPGNIAVNWPGSFGFDLTLFCERSEPRWKTQNS